MKFNTIEGQSDYVFTALIKAMYLDYMANNEGCDNFDAYLYSHLESLGEAAYELIGEYFGDADEAAEDLGLVD